MRHLLLLAVMLILGACARPERAGCPTQKLADIGRDEATRGLAESLPKADCALDAAELELYRKGREDGLARYCTAHRGYQLGLDGKAINDKLCAEDAARELHRGFEIGDNLRSHLRQRDDLLNEARNIERAAAALPEGLAERRKLEDEAAGKRFDARQHENDVEALRGIVAVERWR